jgi:cell wall assembly regulator SMI1
MTGMSMVDEWLAAIGKPESAGATDGELNAAEAELSIEFPSDYRAMMRRVNGGEAWLGDSYVQIWSVEDLVWTNSYFRANNFPPAFTFFGTDGGGEAYAWDSRPNRKAHYIVIPSLFLRKTLWCPVATPSMNS